jgi:glutamine synthetase
VAYQHGCVATFTPKLEEGVAGNGLHFHLQVRKDGRNETVDDEGNLSADAHRLIGGLSEYAESLTAFGNTVASSYLRLVPGLEAPTRVFWSTLNRKALIRVPLGWSKLRHLAGIVNPHATSESEMAESQQTVELRSPDGSTFIHLLLAGIVMAVEWGMTHDRSLEMAEKLRADGPQGTDDRFLESSPVLPASCADSARILAKRRDLYEREGVFPPAMVDYVIRQLQAEDDGQLNKKLAALHQNDRLREMRKIMHKDLHRH